VADRVLPRFPCIIFHVYTYLISSCYYIEQEPNVPIIMNCKLLSKWKGETIIIGDFNEVRFRSDRLGSNFNAHGANLFNSFISNSGLVEVTLGGSRFTWSHKNGSKMSKLDRFLVLENLLLSCPHLNAITLERFLSDHRPILLRENTFDYGPIPF
ncbi:RNA-directed DNA polymerase, eukaryota, partial [Tanacetum coccineum]